MFETIASISRWVREDVVEYSFSTVVEGFTGAGQTIQNGWNWLWGNQPVAEQVPSNFTEMGEFFLKEDNTTKIAEIADKFIDQKLQEAKTSWQLLSWTNVLVASATGALILYKNKDRIYDAYQKRVFQNLLNNIAQKHGGKLAGVLAAYMLLKYPNNERLQAAYKYIFENWQLFLAVGVAGNYMADQILDQLRKPGKDDKKPAPLKPNDRKDGRVVIGKIRFAADDSSTIEQDPTVVLEQVVTYMKHYKDKWESGDTRTQQQIADGLKDYLIKGVAPILAAPKVVSLGAF